MFKHDTWLYRDGEGRLFKAGEPYPAGEWQDHPDKAQSKAQLDGDRDGRRGGSRRRKAP
jgi:hypothetical protein